MSESQTMSVQCPRCKVTIEHVTQETMVYCVVCRKWCRELNAAPAANMSRPIVPPKPKRVRCH